MCSRSVPSRSSVDENFWYVLQVPIQPLESAGICTYHRCMWTGAYDCNACVLALLFGWRFAHSPPLPLSLSLSHSLSLSLMFTLAHRRHHTHSHTHTHTHTHTHRLVESTSRRRLAVTLCTRPQSMQQWATSGPRCSPRVQQARLGLPVLRFKSRGECGTIMEEVRELLAAARTSTIHTSFILHLRTKRFHSRTIMVLPPEVASIGDYVLIRVFFFSVHAVFFGHISSCTIPSVSAYSPPLSLSLSL